MLLYGSRLYNFLLLKKVGIDAFFFRTIDGLLRFSTVRCAKKSDKLALPTVLSELQYFHKDQARSSD